uniref:(northern house mosquito) hypothetical protein n=1 Tax=Culex pipiens TaxID=7175 RepID=A0A8D8FEG7_CULPI
MLQTMNDNRKQGNSVAHRMKYTHTKKERNCRAKISICFFVASFGPVIVTQCLPCWLASSLPSSAFLPERDAHLLATFPGHPTTPHPTFKFSSVMQNDKIDECVLFMIFPSYLCRAAFVFREANGLLFFSSA